MERWLGGLGRVAVRFRWIVIGLWLVVTVACVHVLPSLSSVVDTQNSAFLPSGQPSVQAAALAAPFQSQTAQPALLVASMADGGSVTQPKVAAAVTAAEEAVRGVGRVTTVKDLATSGNSKARIASVEADVPVSGATTNDTVAAIRQVLAQPGWGGTPRPPGLELHLTGVTAVSADNAKANQSAQIKTELLTYLVILIILLLVYRSALAWVVNLLPAGIVLALAEPLVGGLARAGLPVSAVTPVMMTVLILGAGTDYGLFLIMRFRQELERGVEPREAVVSAMGQVGEPIVYAGLTVSGALFCLFVSGFGIYKGLGPALAVGIVVMVLASITLTPALLAVFGRTTFWPSKVVAGPHRDGLWARIAERCAARPGVTLAGGVAFLGLLVLGCYAFSTTGFSGGTASPADSDSAVGTAIIDANFSQTVTNPTGFIFTYPSSVWTAPGGLDEVAHAQQQLAASPHLAQVTGPLNPVGPGITLTAAQLTQLHSSLGPPGSLPTTPPPGLTPLEQQAFQLYRAQSQFISADGRTVQFATTLKTGDPTSAASVDSVPALRSLAASVAASTGATANGVYGIAPISFDVEAVANHDLLVIFPIVALVIGVLLGLLLRSLIAPIFLLLSVALSYGATLGLTNLLFVHIGDQSGINFVLPFLLFVFLVALGEDYNILVMSRIREESQVHGMEPHGIHRAVVAGVGGTGSTVTSAGIILAGTFGAVAIAGGSAQLAQIGVALAVGILLDTFIVRTLLVPSTVQLLGRWTWWPSKLFRMESAPSAQVEASAPAKV